MAFTILDSARLRLRPVRPSDAGTLASLMTPAISGRLASWPPALAPEEALRRIAAAERLALEDGSLSLVLELRQGGMPCGWISIRRVRTEPATGILTYWLGEIWHGLGLMREAIQPAVTHGFATMGLTALRAAVQADNPASIAILEGLGMAPLGPGSIWCPAREREEACLWYEVARPLLELSPMPILAPASEPQTLGA
jgi:ribosomal-protein-alanine N-acetyltransferase